MEQVCDNCEKRSQLTQIDYMTKRNKNKMTMCKECFGNFALMIQHLKRGD